MNWKVAVIALPLGAILAACSSPAGRQIEITAKDDACTPATVSAKAGERLTFVFKNEASGDREVEGVEGTKLEEVIVPAGRTRNVNYTVPQEGGTQKVKCYIPGGPSTIITLEVQ